ncbi:MAG TPA: LysE family transporter [Candidatus Limnocylindria bacterium]|nr:LysE family transporter [Candidatus Limnocylindria bacterium]
MFALTPLPPVHIDWEELILGGSLGMLAGFITSALGGPINVTIVNESARCGFLRAFLIAAGAVVMETIYCSVAFAGFGSVFDSRTVQATMQLVSFILVLWLGLKYLFVGQVPGEERSLKVVESRLHPHTAFWIGFVRVLANPGVLLLWLGITASLLSHGALANTWAAKGVFCLGVASSGWIWFAGLSWGVSRGHGRFSGKALRRISQFSGIVLLATAVLIASRLIHMLARR